MVSIELRGGVGGRNTVSSPCVAIVVAVSLLNPYFLMERQHTYDVWGT